MSLPLFFAPYMASPHFSFFRYAPTDVRREGGSIVNAGKFILTFRGLGGVCLFSYYYTRVVLYARSRIFYVPEPSDKLGNAVRSFRVKMF